MKKDTLHTIANIMKNNSKLRKTMNKKILSRTINGLLISLIYGGIMAIILVSQFHLRNNIPMFFLLGLTIYMMSCLYIGAWYDNFYIIKNK